MIGPFADGQTWTVVLVDRCSGTLETSALAGDATRAAAARIAFVYLDAEARRLPAACVTMETATGSPLPAATKVAGAWAP